MPKKPSHKRSQRAKSGAKRVARKERSRRAAPARKASARAKAELRLPARTPAKAERRPAPVKAEQRETTIKPARRGPTIDEALAQRKSRDIAGVLESLSSIRAPYGRVLEAEMHPELGYGLKLPPDAKGKQAFFGGVRIERDHVLFSLPVLARFPQLQRLMSAELKQAARKKTSFVFQRADLALFSELSALTSACYEHLREDEPA
jgi:hypothetical protein